MVAVAIGLILLVLIILMLPFLLDLNRYRDQYLPILEQALHRKIDVDDVRLVLYPKLGVQLRDVVIAEDPAFSAHPFLQVSSVRVAVLWKPLLQRRIEVESVVVERPILQVIRSAKGDLNLSTIGNIPVSGQMAIDNTKLKGSVSPLLGVLAVKQLTLTGGTVQFEDRTQPHPKPYQIDNLTVNTESVAMGETAHVRMSGLLMPYQTPFEVTGRVGPLQPSLDIPELDIRGHVGKVAVTAQGQVINGRLTVDVQIPQSSTDDVPFELGLTKPVRLTQLHAHLVAPLFLKEPQSSPAELAIDPLRLDLHVGQSVIHVSGKGTPSRFSLIGQSPSFSSGDFPVAPPVQQPFSLEQLQFEAKIQENQLTLHSLKAKAFNGILLATGILDRTRLPYTFSTQGTFEEFSVGTLVQVIRPSSLTMTGAGALKWNLSGIFAPSKMVALDGLTHLTVGKGEVIGFDLVKAVEEALQMPGALGPTTGVTQFSQVEAKAEFVKDGLAIQALTAHAPNFVLRSAGKLGLDQSVNLAGTIAVPSSMAEKIIQRFPLAKLVRQEGQLVLPFLVQGTVQNPVFRLDTRILGDQVRKKVEQRLEKALQGDKRELQKLLDEGKDLLRQFFRQ
jgi:hypothetical protein